MEAFQRLLAELLIEDGQSPSFISKYSSERSGFSPLSFSHSIFTTNKQRFSERFFIAILNRLASRPLLHSLLERIIWISCLPKLRRLATNSLYNAVHFTGTGWDFFGFALAAYAKSIGAKFTIWPAVHPDSWGDDVIDLRLYNKADAVFCQSDYEAAHLVNLGLNPYKVVRCGLPPMCRKDGDRESFREKLNIGNRPAALFLGRRDVGKGYPALLKAWPIVLNQLPDAVLLLAGLKGGEFEFLKEAVSPASIRDLGVPDEKGKADAYAACDVFCLPSAHESFGIVYVEAWSYGKPVICGIAPASRELVENGVTGLWASQQEEELANCIVKLLANKDLAETMGNNGKRAQELKFTPETMLQQHLQTWGVSA